MPLCGYINKLIMDIKNTHKLLSDENEPHEIVNTPLDEKENIIHSHLNTPLETTNGRFSSVHDLQEHIIQGLKMRDSVAIEQLYDAYSASVYGVVFRILLSKELAEQVMQDTFLKAWLYGANYNESKGRLFTWLFNIARNTAIDVTRSTYFQNSRKTENIDSLLDSPGGHSLNPDTLGLREAIKKLDEKYKVLIDLIYFEQYTQQEASEKIGIPLGTVKTRMRFAILELRKIFGR